MATNIATAETAAVAKKSAALMEMSTFVEAPAPTARRAVGTQTATTPTPSPVAA
jgi:hypothetical protein